MATRQELEVYRRRVKLVERAFLADLTRAWKAAEDLPPEGIRDAVVDFLPALIDQYGSGVASLAAAWFEELIGEDARVPDLYSPDTWTASARWALSPLWDGEADHGRAFAHLVDSSLRHVRSFGRATLMASVEAVEGVLWARVPTGLHNCSFCLMLASRGPVYGDRKSGERRQRDGKRFHDKCDCQVVPVRGRWVADPSSPRKKRWDGEHVAGYDFEQAYRDYYLPFHKTGDQLEDTIRRRDKIIRERAKELLYRPDEQRNWGELCVDAREYAFRQASLLSKLPPGRLDVAEIEFLERFEARGERVEWLERDKTGQEKRPDFYWPRMGIKVELKSPRRDSPQAKVKPQSINAAIKSDVFEKETHKRRKENFIIDLGSRILTRDMILHLQDYNLRQVYGSKKTGATPAVIKRLWVISNDGQDFTEITLTETKQ